MQIIGEAAHLDVSLSSLVNPEIPAFQMAFALEKMKEGYDADLVIFDDEIQIKTVIQDGTVVE